MTSLDWVLWGCASCRRTYFSVAWWALGPQGCRHDGSPIGPSLRQSKGLPHWVLLAYGRRWLEADQRSKRRRSELLTRA